MDLYPTAKLNSDKITFTFTDWLECVYRTQLNLNPDIGTAQIQVMFVYTSQIEVKLKSNQYSSNQIQDESYNIHD